MKQLILEQIIYTHQRFYEYVSAKTWLHSIALDVFKILLKMILKLYHNGFLENKKKFLLLITVVMFDTDEWTIEQNSFETIYAKFGTVAFDRFANNLNKKSQ